jgi:serine/threonine-protein kinase
MKNIIHSIGDVIGGRYEIVSEVGQGGMQEVYRANDELLSREVALKVPKSNSAEKRFKRSAVLSAKVNHANVAKTLDYLEENKRFYLIEELIDGCDLSEFLSNYVPRWDPFATARALHHIAKGIAASHHVDVVHRDLKPSNVMVVGATAMNGFKVTDFGIAKMTEKEIGDAVEGGDAGLTASATALGALPYMAPEMIDDMKTAGKPADVWALAAMIYELLTGDRPFGQGYKAVPAIMEAKLPLLPAKFGENPQYKKLSDEIYGIIRSCIQKNPNERPTADQVVNACEDLCYSVADREFGTVDTIKFGNQGKISPKDHTKSGVFWHLSSVYGTNQLVKGQDVWFSRFPGSPHERAFPVVPAHASQEQ